MINISRVGGFLKFKEGSSIKYYNLNVVKERLFGDYISICDGRKYHFSDFSSPSFASSEAVADQIATWKGEAQAGAGVGNFPVVANYSALPAANTVPNTFYYVENTQGTKWLPGSLGGTFYNSGFYYSNGVVWKFAEFPYNASLVTVNAGINNTEFVTSFTFANADKIVNSFQKNVDDSDDITEGAVNLFFTTDERNKLANLNASIWAINTLNECK